MEEVFRTYLAQGEKVGMRYTLKVSPRAPMGLMGIHMGHRAGSSLDFKEHRDYQTGDDLRRIDWNAYARSDRLIVKEYHEEVSPHLDLAIDGSSSMAIENTAKAQATLGVSAILAMAAANAGYTYCVWLLGEQCQRLSNDNERPSLWRGIHFQYRGFLADSLSQTSATWFRPGIRVLVSDLLWPGDPWKAISRLVDRSTSLVVVQILAQVDTDPASYGNLSLVDSETGEIQEVFLDAQIKQDYQNALNHHRQMWYRACQQLGARMVTLVAEDVVQGWKLQELVTAEILTN